MSIGGDYKAIYFGADLKSVYPHSGSSNFQRLISLEMNYELGQDAVRANYGVRAVDQFCAHCGAAWRRFQSAESELHRAIPRHGLRSVDLPRESARHRNLLAGQSDKALWHGLSLASQTLAAGRCQRRTRLAHLGGLGGAAHSARTQVVLQRDRKSTRLNSSHQKISYAV